ncbi:hypothetical protein FRC12_024313, partial [Ceratobasidium sp. 428]
MTCLAGPSYSNPPTQERHDITKLGCLDGVSAVKHSWDLQDSASVVSEVSEVSEASNHSCPTPRPKEQMRRCLHQYKSLALRTLDASAVKEAVFWCCLGLS